MNIIVEEWKEIAGFEDRYAVSNYGRIKRLARNICRLSGAYCNDEPEIIMKQSTHYKGYKFLFLNKDGRRHKRYVHRLVAQAFIPNPENLRIVNHGDLDKAHNHISNLSWVTDSENTLHYYANRPEGDDQDF